MSRIIDSSDDYINRLYKYFPAESLILFLALDGIFFGIGAFGNASTGGADLTTGQSIMDRVPASMIGLGIFLVCLAFTPIYIWSTARHPGEAGRGAWGMQALVSTLAFVVWAYATKGTVFLAPGLVGDARLYDGQMAGSVLILFTLVSGMFLPARPEAQTKSAKPNSRLTGSIRFIPVEMITTYVALDGIFFNSGVFTSGVDLAAGQSILARAPASTIGIEIFAICLAGTPIITLARSTRLGIQRRVLSSLFHVMAATIVFVVLAYATKGTAFMAPGPIGDARLYDSQLAAFLLGALASTAAYSTYASGRKARRSDRRADAAHGRRSMSAAFARLLWAGSKAGAVLLVACAPVIYAFTLIALQNLDQPAPASTSATLWRSTIALPDAAGNASLLTDDGAPLASLAGHDAPVASLDLVTDGATILTTARDGSVRLTGTTQAAIVHVDTLSRLTSALDISLWQPYGAPLSQWSLWLTAQVLPLRIPETAQGRRGRTFKDCDVCPDMVEIGPGSFLMGSPLIETAHRSDEGFRSLVTITRPFAVGRFEVTFDEWDACVADGGCGGYRPDDQSWGRGRLPVIEVSWDDAKAYVAWLSKKTGKTYRLLTEAEWEYVARAGTTTPFWWGASITPAQANYNSRATTTYGPDGKTGEYPGRTVAVDSFEQNPWGLFNVHGNVWEWVEDCYANSYSGASSDGTARQDPQCSSRVLRGGGWDGFPGNLRSANRYGDRPDYRIGDRGFRLARTLNP